MNAMNLPAGYKLWPCPSSLTAPHDRRKLPWSWDNPDLKLHPGVPGSLNFHSPDPGGAPSILEVFLFGNFRSNYSAYLNQHVSPHSSKFHMGTLLNLSFGYEVDRYWFLFGMGR